MAHEVLVAILLTLTAVSLTVIYYQQTTQLTTETVQKVSPQTKEHMEKYIYVFRTAITKVDENTYKLSVTLYNGGTFDYNYQKITFIVMDSNGFMEVLEDPTPATSSCADVLPEGEMCTFYSTFTYTGDPKSLGVRILIDKIEYYEIPTYIPPTTVPPAYFICHSCSECTTLINDTNAGEIIVDINTPVSGDCITVRRPNVVIACQSPLVGDGTGTAILFDNVTGVTLKNCHIENFHTALYFNRSYGLTLTNITLENHKLYARWIVKPDACSLGDIDVETDKGKLPYFQGISNDIIRDTPGVWLVESTGVTISDVDTSIVSPAIVLCGDTDTTIQDVNIPSSPADVALASFGSTGFTITGFYSLAANGMLFEDPSGGELDENVEVR